MRDNEFKNFINTENGIFEDAPLYRAVNGYVSENTYRFHTPGHGGKGLFELDYSLDVTEIPGLDSLFEADGAILKAEEAAAEFFGTERTLISAGGCTLCIQTMLAVALKDGDKAVFGRNCHRSAVNAAALLNVEPVFIMPEQGRIIPGELKSVLLNNPGVKAVYITSPDYYGRISDVYSLSSICKEHGIPLLVDNAHGTHLILSELPLHPIKLGAAMTACSAHKTLPVLTGGAWLNIADKKYAEEAKSKMSVFGSSSPSYPVMISLDVARAWCRENGTAAFKALCRRVGEFKAFAAERGFVFERGVTDPARITLNASSVGYEGAELAELLRAGGVQAEYSDFSFVVLLPSLLCGDNAFAALKSAVGSLEKRKPVKTREYNILSGEKVMTVREALILRGHSTVECEKAEGKVSAQVLCPCPPGIPVCVPGELIRKEHIPVLRAGGIDKITVVG